MYNLQSALLPVVPEHPQFLCLCGSSTSAVLHLQIQLTAGRVVPQGLLLKDICVEVDLRGSNPGVQGSVSPLLSLSGGTSTVHSVLWG